MVPGVGFVGLVVFAGEPEPAPGVCGVVCGVAVPACGVAVPGGGVAVLPGGVAVPGGGVAAPGVELCPAEPLLPAAEPAEPALCATTHAEQQRSTNIIANFPGEFIEFVPRYGSSTASSIDLTSEVRGVTSGRCSKRHAAIWQRLQQFRSLDRRNSVWADNPGDLPRCWFWLRRLAGGCGRRFRI